MTSKKNLIFAMAPPSTGHVNPMCCVVNELCKYPNVQVVFYSDECYRKSIENTGAQFRAFSHPSFSILEQIQKPINEQQLTFDSFLNHSISFSHNILPQLIADTERDQPDLIFHDSFLFPIKYLVEIIKTREANGTWKGKVPKTFGMIPNFPLCDKMLAEFRKNSKESVWMILPLLNEMRRHIALCWKYGISSYNVFGFFTKYDDRNLVAVVPEMQPYREEFDERYIFVGPCVSEEARSAEIPNDNELKNLLSARDSKEKLESNIKLIYMSLGTVFNQNSFVFERAFEAIKNLNADLNQKANSYQVKMIVSLGEKSHKDFTNSINRGELHLPENILLRPKVPQLEVLKRADLFITHCGMNSTTETIKYGVPVIALPISADQPMVARQICDTLSFGVRLDPLNFTREELANTIDRVLTESKYKTNISKMSNMLNKYNGSVNGARIVIDYLNEKRINK